MSSAHFVACMAQAGVPAEAAEEMWARIIRPDYARWDEQVGRCGYCVCPVRLKGKFTRPDGSVVYTTAHEPDGVLLKRCGNRRQGVCPACSFLHRGDDWQVFAAAIAGGRKGVPETVATHPMAFVTLTAPPFGFVHTAKKDGSQCRPRREKPTCPHGRPLWCGHRHDKKDQVVGEPLCPDWYDYEAAVMFNFRAPELWRRFTIALRRALAAELHVPTRKLGQWLRVSFGKVAEMQRRAVVHYHAVIRLDRPGPGWEPPEVEVTAEQMERAIRAAAAKVRLNVPEIGQALTWGEQIDVQHISRDGGLAGELTPEKVAAYLSKYITKSAGDTFGLDGIVKDPEAGRRLGASGHIVRMMGRARPSTLAPSRTVVSEHPAFGLHVAAETEHVHPVTTSPPFAIPRHDTTLLVGEWSFDGVGHRLEIGVDVGLGEHYPTTGFGEGNPTLVDQPA